MFLRTEKKGLPSYVNLTFGDEPRLRITYQEIFNFEEYTRFETNVGDLIRTFKSMKDICEYRAHKKDIEKIKIILTNITYKRLQHLALEDFSGESAQVSPERISEETSEDDLEEFSEEPSEKICKNPINSQSLFFTGRKLSAIISKKYQSHTCNNTPKTKNSSLKLASQDCLQTTLSEKNTMTSYLSTICDDTPLALNEAFLHVEHNNNLRK